MDTNNISIRECISPEELSGCVLLQRKVFNLPEIEISPVRHFIVTRHAGGFTLGAFADQQLVGFVLSVLAFKGNERMFYSHMTAIDQAYQNYGIGARLKWAQRNRALEEEVRYIKWTFQPTQARNAFFNLEKLGALVREYQPNFYGTDYGANENADSPVGIDSDRLFAEWDISSERVEMLSSGNTHDLSKEPASEITTLNNWSDLVTTDPRRAIAEQKRIRAEFEDAFSKNLICRGFIRDENNPRYLLFRD